MPPDVQRIKRQACKVRAQWLALSAWGASERGAAPAVSFGRCPIRAAIRDPEDAVEPRPDRTLGDARAALERLIAGWPAAQPRLAIEGDTGLGKTTLALRRCADHVVDAPIVDGALLVVVPNLERVAAQVTALRAEIDRRGGDPAQVTELLGRHDAGREASDGPARFGCQHFKVAHKHGRRLRGVEREVCRECPAQAWCKKDGYLGHTEQATKRAVIVTTVQRLVHLTDGLWARVAGVLADEDIVPNLLTELEVKRRELRRAVHFITSLPPRSPDAGRLRPVVPLLEAVLARMTATDARGSSPLVANLPDACDFFFTEDGLRVLRAAMPVVASRRAGQSRLVPSPLAPAPWERLRPGRIPRQVFGRLLDALIADILAGDGLRCGTIRTEAGGPRRSQARLRVVQFDLRTVEHLRRRPLLVLDATLHPAVETVLDVTRHRIAYDQGRRVVQALGPLLRLSDLRGRTDTGWALRPGGLRAVAQLAAWFGGRRGYVLVRKDLVPLMRAEAERYTELRFVKFVSPGRERGWDAPAGAVVFVGLGRYARPAAACEHEARALRGLLRRMTGATAALDALERPARALVFRGRGVPLRYRGELVERPTREPADRLAALLQHESRIATVRQFVGRDRSGCGEVLLLRGDPTIGADALVKAEDLPLAVPADQRVLVGGRTRV